MSRKTILFSAIICLIIYVSTGLASDLAYAPGELLVRFAPKPDGKQQISPFRPRSTMKEHMEKSLTLKKISVDLLYIFRYNTKVNKKDRR